MKHFKYILPIAVFMVFAFYGVSYWSSNRHKQLDRELFEAARTGDVTAAKHLISQGANVEADAQEPPFGTTPLTIAVVEGHAEVVKVLLESGAGADYISADGDGTALGEAAAKGHDKIVQILLDKGANIEIGVPDGKMTPLMMAAWRGRASTVKLLLAQGADAKAKDKRGKTALDWAAQTLRLGPSLYAKGANPQETVQILKRVQIKGQ